MGFRPFVYRLARKHGLKGWVNNNADGVHIRINAEEKKAWGFYSECIEMRPRQSLITGHRMQETTPEDFKGFKILTSDDSGPLDLAITPDFGICKNCLNELKLTQNRRYEYPFITCTHCGPRYSISRQLPYDRHLTTMAPFQMCDECQTEYQAPKDRRYYSQTNSCKSCGISLQLNGKSGDMPTESQEILDCVDTALKEGKIIAVKGIGGYLLLCDATRPGIIKSLRKRKHRPEKPFAVMYPSLQLLEQDVFISDSEKGQLQGAVAPILILPAQAEMPSGLCHAEVAPGLRHLGVMLPYAPLLALISHRFGKPMVATSANVNGSPIVYQDKVALKTLFSFADLVLSHNRKITAPQDDSVIKPLAWGGGQIMLRRSRGLAPNYYNNSFDLTDGAILALGAQMKGSFTLSTPKNIYVSQFLGNLDAYESQQHYQQVLRHFLELTKATPQTILTDLHPAYFTTGFGEGLGHGQGKQLRAVQHHEAHFAAVLGENNLLGTNDKILGVVWDGTGLGGDGQIWGGEFFQYHKKRINRVSHFRYFPVLAGDKMAREPRLSALALTHGNEILKKFFPNSAWSFYNRLISQPKIQTSSVGRIFDSVASVLDIAQTSTYEGQPALLLEQQALKYFDKTDWEKLEAFPFEVSDGNIHIRPMMEEAIRELKTGTPKDQIAARFHETLVAVIDIIARQGKYHRLAFSGGVFQNAVLVDLIQLRLKHKYTLYFHRQLPPNDENISFGQFIHYLIHSGTSNNLISKKHIKPDPYKIRSTCV